MLLLGIAAVVALILGTVGIYGVISYVVSQRTREIGVRMALGAREHEVSLMVIKQGATMALVGVAVGVTVGVAVAVGVLVGVGVAVAVGVGVGNATKLWPKMPLYPPS